MQTIEFNSTINNNTINIPQQYWKNVPLEVKVTLQSIENPLKKKFKAMQLKTNGFRFNREEANER
jgi:hypothetical protein